MIICLYICFLPASQPALQLTMTNCQRLAFHHLKSLCSYIQYSIYFRKHNPFLLLTYHNIVPIIQNIRAFVRLLSETETIWQIVLFRIIIISLLLNRQENKALASDLDILYQSRFLTFLLAGDNNCTC